MSDESIISVKKIIGEEGEEKIQIFTTRCDHGQDPHTCKLCLAEIKGKVFKDKNITLSENEEYCVFEKIMREISIQYNEKMNDVKSDFDGVKIGNITTALGISSETFIMILFYGNGILWTFHNLSRSVFPIYRHIIKDNSTGRPFVCENFDEIEAIREDKILPLERSFREKFGEIKIISTEQRIEMLKAEHAIVMESFSPRPFTNKLISAIPFFVDEFENFFCYNYETGVWRENAASVIDTIMRTQLVSSDNVKKRMIEEVVADVRGLSRKYIPFPKQRPELIAFENGVIDIKSGLFTEFRPEMYILNKIPINYKKELNCLNPPKIIDKILREILDNNVIDIYELLAYCMYRDQPYHKMFFLYGSGSNGKSTVLKIMTNFLGNQNISNVSLDGICDSPFHKAELHGKLANIAGEVTYENLKDTDSLKQLTGDESNIMVERKYKNPFKFKNYAKMIFACNQIPGTNDKTNAYARRVYIIDFLKNFRVGSNAKSKIEDSIPKQEYEELAVYLIGVLKNLIKKDFVFANHMDDEKIMEKYEKLSDPIRRFVDTMCEHEDVMYIICWEFRKLLKAWCHEIGFYRTLTDVEISRKMKDMGYEIRQKSINGYDMVQRCYVGIDVKSSSISLKESSEINSIHAVNKKLSETSYGINVNPVNGVKTPLTPFTALNENISDHENFSENGVNGVNDVISTGNEGKNSSFNAIHGVSEDFSLARGKELKKGVNVVNCVNLSKQEKSGDCDNFLSETEKRLNLWRNSKFSEKEVETKILEKEFGFSDEKLSELSSVGKIFQVRPNCWKLV